MLEGVSATDATHAWAVGVDQSLTGYSPVTLSWDGHVWRQQPSPDPGAEGSELWAVDTLPSHQAWAVGLQLDASATARSLIEHWNGTSWSTMRVPFVGPWSDSLYAVDALSPTNVWASGIRSAGTGPSISPLLLHYDGHAWRHVGLPSRLRGRILGLAALSPTNVWATGTTSDGGPLVLHLTESGWHRVFIHQPEVALIGVAASSSHNVIAVGVRVSGSRSSAFAERFNGTKWTPVPVPAPHERSEFDRVSVTPYGRTFTVGVRFNHQQTGLIETRCA